MAKRINVAVTILFIALLALGVTVQRRWDAQCSAEQHGSRWNSDIWQCAEIGQ